MGRITVVTPNNDYTLFIDLESGDRILFNMQNLVRTIAFKRLQDLQYFKKVAFEDKAIYWGENDARLYLPERITLDEILFFLRD
jgi:hypothetical protein